LINYSINAGCTSFLFKKKGTVNLYCIRLYKSKVSDHLLAIENLSLTDRQVQLLRLLYKVSNNASVFTVNKTQGELAKELNLTRQALNIHLRRLREEHLIRTGRGFIDLTEKALQTLGVGTAEAFIFLKIQPSQREYVYDKIKKLESTKMYRVTGEIDLVAEVPQAKLDSFLEAASGIEGVISTSSHVVISIIK